MPQIYNGRSATRAHSRQAPLKHHAAAGHLMSEARTQEGVVHGHIHNYEHLTYVHGHVHHRSDSSTAPSRPVTQVASGTATAIPAAEPSPMQLPARPSAEGSTRWHTSPDASHTLQAVPSSSASVTMNQPSMDSTLKYPCSDYADCEHFEFVNYHGTSEPPSLPERKRRKADCSCQPKVLEICCDAEHEKSILTSSHTSTIPSPSVRTTNAELEEQQNADSLQELLDVYADPSVLAQKPSSPLPQPFLPLDCDLTCNTNLTTLPEQQQVDFQQFCDACKSDKQLQNHYHHADKHSHVFNTDMDMRILGDLCDISSLYEVSLDHGNANDKNYGRVLKNDSLNMLESTVKNIHCHGSDSQEQIHHRHANPANHHHHRVQFHLHKPAIAEETGNLEKLEDITSPLSTSSSSLNTNTTMSTPIATLNKDERPSKTLSNTINFDWQFIKSEEADLKCKWLGCEEGFDSLFDLQKHLIQDHVPEQENEHELSCNWKDCETEVSDVCSLVNHINGEHGINFDMRAIDPAFPQGSTMGDHCIHNHLHISPQETSNEPLSANPEIKLEKISDFPCRWKGCVLSFHSAAELNNHLENDHLPPRQSLYKCQWDSCTKSFTQRQKILRHLKVHSGHRPYKCEICSKTFSSIDTKVQHIRTHSGEKPFKCHICGKCFAISSSLRIHIRTHTGEKPLKCKICGKAFNESSNLTKHLRTHQRPYKCTGCSRSFDTHIKLKSHQHKCQGALPKNIASNTKV